MPVYDETPEVFPIHNLRGQIELKGKMYDIEFSDDSQLRLLFQTREVGNPAFVWSTSSSLFEAAIHLYPDSATGVRLTLRIPEVPDKKTEPNYLNSTELRVVIQLLDRLNSLDAGILTIDDTSVSDSNGEVLGWIRWNESGYCFYPGE